MGCRVLSTERLVHKNKHKNKAFINFSLIVSIAPLIHRLVKFCAKGFFAGGEVPILAGLPFSIRKNRHEVRGGFPFPF
jgi:hypothetical protein